MGIDFNLESDHLIVHLEGELDLHSVNRLREKVEAQLAQAEVSTLLIDLSRVTFMDSSGLGFILGRYRRLREQGGRIVLVAPVSQVRRVLELAGVERIMEIIDAKEAACGAREEEM